MPGFKVCNFKSKKTRGQMHSHIFLLFGSKFALQISDFVVSTIFPLCKPLFNHQQTSNFYLPLDFFLGDPPRSRTDKNISICFIPPSAILVFG